jgi:DNA-binding NtrC family response regulator
MHEASAWTALVVENEFIIAFDLEERLVSLGAVEVRVTSTALEAAKIVDVWRPTIALVDWRLADGPAEKLIGRLLERGVAVIVVSGSARWEMGLPDSPSIAYVQKPISDLDLSSAVARLLQPA